MSNLFAGAQSVVRGRTIELDFLRGIAIIAVMGYHFHTVDTGFRLVPIIQYPFTHFGREGVNLFFTLSGFLVGGLLLRQYADTGAIDAGRFIVRRIFKIWPAYYVLIVFHFFAGRHPTSTFLLQNLTHLQNYLGTSISQTWSLAVEEHFYLVLPALLLLFARWRLRANAILALLGMLCLLVLAARSVVVAKGDIDAAFFQTQYRIDSLLAGVMLAAVYWMKPALYRRLAQRKGWLMAMVVLLVAWLAFATSHVALDESIGYTIQAIGYVALIVLMLEHAGTAAQTWLFRAVAWVGVYSYGIYLWHSLAFAPADILIAKAGALGIPALVVWAVALVFQTAIAISAGYVTTRLVEFPFLRLRNALFPARGAAGAGPSAPVPVVPMPEPAAAADNVPPVAGGQPL
ncbi:acyltransferase [Trinickia caryophylli]|uniref:Peptidoglycan/LPS O-acetylase OafA/YrhL, contains acyltransferase and SGNH-hydrolase domains n=1 Tax=Trinickia caryophylli TaxID=28094 RepID=A0A1X7CG62_TRICW|nr:acyltransferase [Trinickia caryophylli]PMS11653.1 acyltransferase [Trinickia caryophylli]TRX20405.1 acyltransferase [Trinickia caryophylli]WQE13614.1 acyltransferase [Trinickia caryophylli]SME95975.1 Peptidoglycan/LPS O-acetylase OafA/YrhL, contains acyltransferase and SGNH-hydrolase domains [Trinickia caryophylli]